MKGRSKTGKYWEGGFRDFELVSGQGPLVDHFPLAIGNLWEYSRKISIDNDTWIYPLTCQITGTATISGKESYIMRKEEIEDEDHLVQNDYLAEAEGEFRKYAYEHVEGNVPGPYYAPKKSKGHYYIYQGERFNSVKEIMDYVRGKISISSFRAAPGRATSTIDIYDSPRIFLKFPIAVGDSWMSFFQSELGTFSRQVVDVEQVAVPAGIFTAYKIEVLHPIEGATWFSWYGSVGLIKSYVKVEDIVKIDANGNYSTFDFWEICELESFNSNEVTSTSITRPDSGASISGNVVVVKATSLSEDVTGIDFYCKPSDVDTWTMIGSGTAQSPTYRVYWDITGLEDGNYSLKAIAKSINGNIDRSPPEITVTIDHQNPDYVEGWVKESDDNVVAKGDDGCTLTIPAGAVDTQTVVRISRPTTIPASNLPAAGLYIEIVLENGQTRLNSPVTISFVYNEENGIVVGTNIHEEDLKIYIYTNTSWEELSTDVNTVDNIATATTNHFTIFGLFGSAAPDLDSVIVYPNPFKPNDKVPETGDCRGIIFDQLTENATLKIFNLAGELVYEKSGITGKVQWNAKNESGKEVASGVYIYLITDSGKKASGKLVIIR